MAELLKKLHIKRGTTIETAKIYSTTAEAGTDYIFAKVDDVPAFVPIGDTADSRATNGRVTKNNETKAILNSGKPPYTEKSWTTAGTYTFTVPAGVVRVRVAVCGGGGGAGAFTTGGTGGTSSFGDLIQATGGAGQTGGTPNGKNGTATSRNDTNVYGASGFALSFNQENGKYGTGGSGWHDHHVSGTVRSGGSGGYYSDYVTVEPLKTYQITVGAAGQNRNASSDDNDSVWGGSGGFVLIGYGGDV